MSVRQRIDRLEKDMAAIKEIVGIQQAAKDAEPYLKPGDTVRLTDGPRMVRWVHGTVADAHPAYERLARPRFKHDCPKCICLGAFTSKNTGASWDMYLCDGQYMVGVALGRIEDHRSLASHANRKPGSAADQAIARAREWGLLPEKEPARPEPKFKVGQWVQDPEGRVWPIHDIEWFDNGWQYRREYAVIWYDDNECQPSAPDYRFRWPNGAPWPGTKVRVVEHPVGITGATPDDEDEAGRILSIRKIHQASGWIIFEKSDMDCVWAWNCVPVQP